MVSQFFILVFCWELAIFYAYLIDTVFWKLAILFAQVTGCTDSH